MAYARVLWQGKRPELQEIFRLVDHGKPRPGHERETQFIVEQARGRDAMYQKSWGGVHETARGLCIRTLSYLLGDILLTSPEQLHVGHPIGCELNLAVIEGREAKGCDCFLPDDPSQPRTVEESPAQLI